MYVCVCGWMCGVDAAKRRQLPAWIREGLEKMEREKQRQLDRERQLQEAVNARQLQDSMEKEAVKQMNDENAADGPMAAVKSKFVRTAFSLCLPH